jgi:hypothetical protein
MSGDCSRQTQEKSQNCDTERLRNVQKNLGKSSLFRLRGFLTVDLLTRVGRILVTNTQNITYGESSDQITNRGFGC